MQKTGVPRSTFYRYYHDKEDVLFEYSSDLTELLALELRKKNYRNNYDFLFILFTFLKDHSTYLKVLITNHKEYIILNTINQNINKMKLNSKDQTIITYQAGGLYNVIIQWIKTDFKEPPENISQEIINIMNHINIDDYSETYSNTFDQL